VHHPAQEVILEEAPLVEGVLEVVDKLKYICSYLNVEFV
jgi:hypothetical protein